MAATAPSSTPASQPGMFICGIYNVVFRLLHTHARTHTYTHAHTHTHTRAHTHTHITVNIEMSVIQILAFIYSVSWLREGSTRMQELDFSGIPLLGTFPSGIDGVLQLQTKTRRIKLPQLKFYAPNQSSEDAELFYRLHSLIHYRCH